MQPTKITEQKFYSEGFDESLARDRVAKKAAAAAEKKTRKSSKSGRAYRVREEGSERSTGNPGLQALRKTFTGAWETSFPGERPPAWVGKEQRLLKQLVDAYDQGTVERMLDSFVREWPSWQVRYDWANDNRPAIGFFYSRQADIYATIQGNFDIIPQGRNKESGDPRLTMELLQKDPQAYVALYLQQEK